MVATTEPQKKETLFSYLYKKIYRNTPPLLLLLLCRKDNYEAYKKMVFGGNHTNYSFLKSACAVLQVVRL